MDLRIGGFEGFLGKVPKNRSSSASLDEGRGRKCSTLRLGFGLPEVGVTPSSLAAFLGALEGVRGETGIRLLSLKEGEVGDLGYDRLVGETAGEIGGLGPGRMASS